MLSLWGTILVFPADYQIIFMIFFLWRKELSLYVSCKFSFFKLTFLILQVNFSSLRYCLFFLMTLAFTFLLYYCVSCIIIQAKSAFIFCLCIAFLNYSHNLCYRAGSIMFHLLKMYVEGSMSDTILYHPMMLNRDPSNCQICLYIGVCEKQTISLTHAVNVCMYVCMYLIDNHIYSSWEKLCTESNKI